MKKTSLTIVMLAVVLGLAFSAVRVSPATNTKTLNGTGYVQVDLLGAVIPTGNANYIEAYIDDMGGFAKLNGYVQTVSAGSITTANVAWLLSGGTVLSSNVLTLGTDITTIQSSRVRVRVFNPSANATTAVTMNIIVR